MQVKELSRTLSQIRPNVNRFDARSPRVVVAVFDRFDRVIKKADRCPALGAVQGVDYLVARGKKVADLRRERFGTLPRFGHAFAEERQGILGA